VLAELALPAQRRPLRLDWAAAARLVLPATILIALIAELLLAERKYALFGGGFGQSQALEAPLEIAAFLAAIIACQTFVFWLLYRGLRRLHSRRGSAPLFVLNYAFFVGGGAIAALIGKYQALAYFSDSMSFQIVRNLGGGSLVEALLFSLSEAGLILIGIAGAAVFYLAALILSRRWRRSAPPPPDCYRIGPARGLAAFAGIALLLLAVNRVDDARPAAARFSAVLAFSILFDQLTDFDRDGWSFYSWPIDRQPFDAARHPYALDVPGDGIDQDGYGGDFAFSGSTATPPPPVIAGPRPNVILIVLESTRADAIGRVVDGRPLTPVLDALARGGSSAPAAYSHVGFTTFSLQSLFSGELAPVDDRQSLVRDFLANGYRVGVFSGQGEDFGGTAQRIGLRRAQIYVDAAGLREERAFGSAGLSSLTVDGKILLREFDRRLGRREDWAQPHFLFFNLQSAHFPYHSPGMDRILAGEPIPRGQIGAGNRDWVQRTYWNAVAYNDRLIGALIERLRRLGVLDNTLVVVTADHGESLFDDGFLGHGHMLSDEQTRIPFILSAPGIPLPPVMGLADMRRAILAAAGAGLGPAAPAPVFQYLGSLDRPGSIGTVDSVGGRTIFNLFDESVWTSRSGRWTRYASLGSESAERRAADALIGEWARQRWLRRLREQPAAR
jgi:hypothetical protein